MYKREIMDNKITLVGIKVLRITIFIIKGMYIACAAVPDIMVPRNAASITTINNPISQPIPVIESPKLDAIFSPRPVFTVAM